MRFKYTENKSKYSFKSYKLKNNVDEFLFFGTEKLIKQNLENLSNIKISNRYYLPSGEQPDWSTCNSLNEINNEIFTVDQNKDHGSPEINIVGKNNDKFFINCSYMHISDFFDNILKFRKNLIQKFSKIDRNIIKLKLENDHLIFLISSLSGLKILKSNYENLNNDVKLKFKIKDGIYNIETFYFPDIFGDTDISGFNTLGHLIERER